MSEANFIERAWALAQQWQANRRKARWVQAYRDLFGPASDRPMAAEIVLADLREFCRARVSTWDADPRVHALLEGRREVWLRISNALNLDEASMAALNPGDFDGEGDDNG